MVTLLVTMSIDPRRADLVPSLLRDDVVAWVRRQRGFCSGRWLCSEDRTLCLGVLDFVSVDDARAVAGLLRAGPGHPARAWQLGSAVVASEIAATARPPDLRGAG
jgi:hypothetical protein